jgi:hypothetical protein
MLDFGSGFELRSHLSEMTSFWVTSFPRTYVIPAQAGIQEKEDVIPAKAGIHNVISLKANGKI